MSESNGTHPDKPGGVFCRLAALLKWTGWSRETVRNLEYTGDLTPVRFKQNPNKQPRSRRRKGKQGHRYYRVQEVEKLVG